MPAPRISVDTLMGQIETDLRHKLRSRMLERGGAHEYANEQLFAEVESLLRRAIEQRHQDALLLPELLSDADEWRPSLHLRFVSHRPAVGKLLIAIKRRVLLPLNRWLFEYSLENFRRQERVNATLFACLEELAIDNAHLRQELASLRKRAD